MILENKTERMYNTFNGLPLDKPIVRNNQRDDAFELVVLQSLYGLQLDLSFQASEASEIAKYVIAPPDEGIDIFIENDEGEETYYDVIQVKNKPLKPVEIKKAFAVMKNTINSFCKDAGKIKSLSCKKILGASSLDKNTKKYCRYYVVHTGNNDFNCLSENETVINRKNLIDILENGITCVKQATFQIEGKNNFLTYDRSDAEDSIVCSLNCYDLALVNNKFFKTSVGKNILYGQNLREGLGKKNKAFYGIKNSVEYQPNKFWFYNNGLTIIADSYEIINSQENTKIKINNFSIANGAQTTSSLGNLLNTFKVNKNYEQIEAMKEAYVLVRIVKSNNNEVTNNITISTNTQNSILSRDMIVNREEQIKLQNRLLDGNDVMIYMETRRGAQIPSYFNKKYKHRMTKNENLAQIAYAAFEFEPFTAKDKKSTIFYNDYTHDEYTINKHYHMIFNYDKERPENNGILFKKSKEEIDESLFVNHLYNLASHAKKEELRNSITQYNVKYNSCQSEKEKMMIKDNIDNDSLVLECIGCSRFYCITNYFMLRERFDIYVDKNKTFDYDRFYEDKAFRDSIVRDFSDLVLMGTIRVIKSTAKSNLKTNNIANWTRKKECERAFLAEMTEQLTTNAFLKNHYVDFFNKYKK